MSPLPQPQTTNRFPGCVAMQLHLETKATEPLEAPDRDPFAPLPQPAIVKSESPESAVAMSLTINFGGEHAIDIPGAKVLGIPSGKATFGVTRCQLDFTLFDCRLPLDAVVLSAPFKRSVTVETQQERATETQAGVTLGGTVGEKPSGTSSGTVGYKQSGKTVEKVTTEHWQIRYAGDEDTPMWVFEVKDGAPVLQGSLTHEPLGTLYLEAEASPLTRAHNVEVKLYQAARRKGVPVEAAPAEEGTVLERDGLSFIADLVVRPEDVRLTWGTYGLTQNITRNRLALIERAIALKHIGPQLKDGLSRTEWQHD